MKQLYQRVAGTFGLRIASLFLAFLTSIILARLLGPADFGTYTYLVSWVYLLAIPATLGFDGFLGREVAIYQTQSAWSDLNGLIKSANLLSLLVSTGLAFVAGTLNWYLNRGSDIQVVIGFWIAMIALPIMTLRKICRGSMKGLSQIVLGLLPEMLVGPLVLLALIGGTFWWQERNLSTLWVTGAYSITTGLTLIIIIIFHNYALPTTVKRAIPKYQILNWIKLALPFMLIDGVNEINARVDILMLGSLKGGYAAGLYTPVSRGADLIIFSTMAFAVSLSPKVASLYTQKKSKEIQQILSKTNRLIFIISGVFTLLLISLGHQYLLIFGTEFTQGYLALVIRCLGRFITISSIGLSSMVLAMTGYAHLMAITGFLGAGINIVLNAILIPNYGINGAALATTSSVLIAGIINAILVYQKTGIHSTILGEKFASR